MVAGRAPTLLLAAAALDRNELAVSYAALALVAFLGFVLLVVVVSGARYVRRLNRRPLPPSKMVSDRWYEKPLVEPQLSTPSDEAPEGE
ncbi:MAG: hypothetical protein JNG90_19695 [Planctomycetaceae bacterium]|nr:hypothetical protein [Planctomycetaceae bacterium]